MCKFTQTVGCAVLLPRPPQLLMTACLAQVKYRPVIQGPPPFAVEMKLSTFPGVVSPDL